MKILGLDPGLGTTGWGVIEADGNRLAHVANGQIRTDTAAPLPRRLAYLADELDRVIAEQLLKLMDALDEDDDVQTVWGNENIPDEELEKLG